METAAATFRVKPSAKPIREVTIAPVPVGEFFRPPKRPATDTFVQIKTKRIITPGEKREISLAGAAARRGKPTNFLKSKQTKSRRRMFF